MTENIDTKKSKMISDPKEPFRKFFELFAKDLKEQPNTVQNFPCDKSNGDKNKTIQFNIQWEEIYSPQIEVHKAINEHILNKYALLADPWNTTSI